MLNKQTVKTIGIQAEALEKRINMNKNRKKYQRKMNGKTRKIGLADVIETRKLVDFSYHLQIHDWGWIPFYLKEENVWNNILELTKVDFFLDFFFFKYCRAISRDVMQSNFFLSSRTSIGFHKRLKITSIHKSMLPHHRLIEWFIS